MKGATAERRVRLWKHVDEISPEQTFSLGVRPPSSRKAPRKFGPGGAFSYLVQYLACAVLYGMILVRRLAHIVETPASFEKAFPAALLGELGTIFMSGSRYGASSFTFR